MVILIIDYILQQNALAFQNMQSHIPKIIEITFIYIYMKNFFEETTQKEPNLMDLCTRDNQMMCLQ